MISDQQELVKNFTFVFRVFICYYAKGFGRCRNIGHSNGWMGGLLSFRETCECFRPIFLGARAPLELAHVKKKKKTNEKVSNSNNLLSPASTCTLILEIVPDSPR